MTKKRRSNEARIGSDLITSKSDRREYQFHKLTNGIEALLVKIPESQSSKSAISVSVGCGSMHEPDEFGGLAHFIEHCIFLGNRKYPTRNSLDKLLAKHNGYSNAYTELEQTTYFLEVNTEAIGKAVDIFASAFESPSFDEELCCAELEAVDSEYHGVVNSDSCRIEQMICHLSDSTHLYNRKFTWGNRDSLLTPHGKSKLVHAARDLFNQYYLPSNMRVCMVSSSSFSKMVKLLTDSFGVIGSNISASACASTEETSHSPLRDCRYPIKNLPMTVLITPIKETHRVYLYFQMPASLGLYSYKPLEYISELIGHEGEGSLIEILRTLNLASSVTAGVGSGGYYKNGGLSIFEIKIVLTKVGLQNIQKVVYGYVFPFIEEVSRKLESADSIAQFESFYQETKALAMYQFDYVSEQSSKEPIDTAEELCPLLLPGCEISSEHVLVHEFLYAENFDKDVVLQFIGCMTRDRCLTMIVSPEVAGRCALEESKFGIKYGFTKIEDPHDSDSTELFTIPPLVNPYVPSLQTVHATQEETASFVEPETVLSYFTVFRRIRSIPTPKAELRLRCDVVVGGGDTVCPPVAQMALLSLFVDFVTDALKPVLYPAHLAGYLVTLSAEPRSETQNNFAVQVTVNGSHEHLLQVVTVVLETLRNSLTKEEPSQRLGRIVESQKMGYANAELHPVSSQAVSMRRSLVAPGSYFRSRDLLRELMTLIGTEVESTQLFEKIIFCVPKGIIVGSVDDATVHALEALVSRTVVGHVGDPCCTNSVPIVLVNELVESEVAINPAETNSVAILYYQLSPCFDLTTLALCDVIADLMSQPFFDSLRTEEQLGYSVECGSRSTNGSIGIEFMIQSSCEPADRLVARIERFIANFFAKEIAPMSKSEFSDQIESLVESLLEPPSCLTDEARDLWDEFLKNRNRWNINDLLCAEIKRMFSNKQRVKEDVGSIFKQEKRIVVNVNSIQQKSV